MKTKIIPKYNSQEELSLSSQFTKTRGEECLTTSLIIHIRIVNVLLKAVTPEPFLDT